GDAIAVTVIATGFNAEQQHEIVNTEAKKIIHTLEDEQKAERNLFSKNPMGTLNSVQEPETPPAPAPEPKEEEPVVRHTLEQENDLELISTSEIIKNMNVIYEEVSIENEEDFIIIDTTPKIREIEVSEPEIVKPVTQQKTTLAFDMPLDDHSQEEEKSKTVTFDMEDNVSHYEVKNAVEVVPVTKLSQDGTKRYSLDDYMEVEDRLNNAKPSVQKQEPTIEKELQFEKKVIEQQPTEELESEEIDPMNSSIEESLRSRADERRRKLKDFNYKF